MNAVVRERFLFEKTRNGSDPVTLFDAEFHDRQKTRFKAYKRDVGSMQGGHHCEFAVHYLSCKIRADRMWYRVVSVDDIQLVKSCNFNDFACERRRVHWEFKKGIAGKFHFMIVHIPLKAVQSHRHGVADEMDLMPSSCESLS